MGGWAWLDRGRGASAWIGLMGWASGDRSPFPFFHRAGSLTAWQIDSNFSIRWLFVVTAMCAVVCTALWGRPTPVTGGLFLLIEVAIPAVAFVGIIQGRGYVRAFCIGAAIPSSFGMKACWDYVSSYHNDTGPISWLENAGRFFGAKEKAALVWAAALIVGLACVGFYWLIKPPKES